MCHCVALDWYLIKAQDRCELGTQLLPTCFSPALVLKPLPKPHKLLFYSLRLCLGRIRQTFILMWSILPEQSSIVGPESM